MSTSNISFYCESVEVQANNGREVYAEIKGASDRNVLDNYSLSQIVEHFGVGDLLEEIGESDCVEHFNLTPNNPDEDD
jgi:hypothetical protein